MSSFGRTYIYGAGAVGKISAEEQHYGKDYAAGYAYRDESGWGCLEPIG